MLARHQIWMLVVSGEGPGWPGRRIVAAALADMMPVDPRRKRPPTHSGSGGRLFLG
jgi:hypothetical protein